MESRLGTDRLDSIHIHMYPIEYDHNGEKRHRAFSDRLDSALPPDRKNSFFPRADDFVNVLRDMNLAPVVICEAKDTQDVGARLMKSLYYGDLSNEVFYKNCYRGFSQHWKDDAGNAFL